LTATAVTIVLGDQGWGAMLWHLAPARAPPGLLMLQLSPDAAKKFSREVFQQNKKIAEQSSTKKFFGGRKITSYM